MSSDCFRVRLTESAKDHLRRIGKRYGKKTYEIIRDLIQGLELHPEQKGQALQGVLRGLYSLHYSRFRIIYHIAREELVVLVVGAGYHRSDSRTDIYRLIERMVESGVLAVQDEVSDASSDSAADG